MKDLIQKYESSIVNIHETHQREVQQIHLANDQSMQSLRSTLEDEKNKLIGSYMSRIKQLEDKLAEEIRKMEDSNGYLKKMYEEKINKYERDLKENKEAIANLNNKIS